MNIAIIFAGGVGSRMNNSEIPKQFIDVYGKPVIIHTLEHFQSNDDVDAIFIVCKSDWIEYLKEKIIEFNISKTIKIIPGGSTAQESTRNGLNAVKDYYKDSEDIIVMIHDGVRPLINQKLISENIKCARKNGNAITVVPAIETIIQSNDNKDVINILNRENCMLARAPQTFYLNEIIDAHKKSITDNLEFIDSASLMFYYGEKLNTVFGPEENLKITTPSDLEVFISILSRRELKNA